MGHPVHYGVSTCRRQFRSAGRTVQGTRFGRSAQRLVMFAAAAGLGLAFATPAHADDQTVPSPPLMVGKGATITPDAVDDTVVEQSVPDETSVQSPNDEATDVISPQNAETPGNTEVERPLPAYHQNLRTAVLRTFRVTTAARAKATSEHRRQPSGEWYRGPVTQYQHAARPASSSRPPARRPRPVAGANNVATSPRIDPASTRVPCDGMTSKCLSICGWGGHQKAASIGRPIAGCILLASASPVLEQVHALILEKARAGTEDVRFSSLSRRYHCAAAQYQDSACVAAPLTTPATGAPTPVRTPSRTERVGADRARLVRVLAAAAQAHTASAPLRGTTQVRRATKGLVAPAQPGAHAIRAAQERSAVAGAPSGGSFLTSLLIMLGLCGLAVAVMLATERNGFARSLAGTGSSLRSRRLSTSRISLRSPRGDGEGRGTIAYRE